CSCTARCPTRCAARSSGRSRPSRRRPTRSNAPARRFIWSRRRRGTRCRGNAVSHSRRDFLVRTTCAALGAAAFHGTVRQFGLANLLATPPNSLTGNYRALVCVFLNGGSDANSMVIPNDGYYASYHSQRPTVAIPQGSILPLAAPPASLGGRTFGFHPN